MHSVVVFRSTRDAIRADRICKAEKLTARVVPVPKHISSECGMCLKILRDDSSKATELLEKNNINIKIYDV